MDYKVVFSPEARDDLLELYDYIAERSGPRVAFAYVQRIEAFCRRFTVAAERGMCRDDIRPGLRVVGFEGRVSIAFHVEAGTAMIDRILYGGRDIASAVGRE